MGETIESRDATWKVLDIAVHGTITSPAGSRGSGSRPAVVLVAGSGPTDRDWCSPLLPGKNGSGRLLAEALARRGFVTLRYDKLASGPHVRENLPRFAGKVSMQSHTDELAGAVEAVVSETAVDGERLFALTNSEGAIHAVNYQLRAKGARFRGLVLTGAPGRTIGEVGRGQLLAQGRSMPGVDALMSRYDEAIAEFQAGRPMVPDPSLPDGVKMLLRSLENPTNLPFARELWAYSLPQHVAGLGEPILVLIGKKDIQVDWRVDGRALEEATARNGDASFVYPENANHVLKHEGLPVERLSAEYVSSRYNAADASLDEEAASAILGWLDRRR